MLMRKKNMMMAYALGIAKIDDKEDDRKKVVLGDINEEWKKYEIWYNAHEKGNSAYTLYYKGKFGKENGYVDIIRIPCGWEIDHIATLMVAALEMHKTEIDEMMEF